MRAPAQERERLLAAMLELAPGGVEEVEGAGFVEYALYGAPGELPDIPPGRAEVGGIGVEVHGTEVPDDWAERWKRFHGPILVGGTLYVRPPWSEPAVRPGVHEIVIDPGRAFGTGAHPTTRLCLELMLELPAHGSFADLGCGSGILAIAASKLGFDPVTALDADRAAVETTAHNAAANGARLAEVRRANLRAEPAPAADAVAANLARPLLLRVAELMADRPRSLIASGLLVEEADAVVAAFAPLRERRRLVERGWSAVLLTR